MVQGFSNFLGVVSSDVLANPGMGHKGVLLVGSPWNHPWPLPDSDQASGCLVSLVVIFKGIQATPGIRGFIFGLIKGNLVVNM